MISRLRCALMLAALFVAAALAAGCGGDGGPTPPRTTPGPGGNLLANPSFEEGAAPWFGLGEPSTTFTVSSARALSGEKSALLRMRDTAADPGTGMTHSKVYYLVQEISPEEMPEVVRGHYFVENWVKGAAHQYVQFVIIAFNPTNFDPGNWQIRYPLAGIDSQPFAIANAQFRFVSREPPVQGEWVPFEIRLRDDYQDLWGKVPEGFTSLRLLFEVRWDNKIAGEGTPTADVYYDDLYAGDD